MASASSSVAGSKRQRTETYIPYHSGSFLEKTRQVTELICSFLDAHELARISVSNRYFKHILPNHKFLWQDLMPKFGLPDAYWPECSQAKDGKKCTQAMAGKNFSLIVRMNQFAVQFFSKRNVRADMAVLQVGPFALSVALARSPRQAFVETIKPFTTTFLEKAGAQFTNARPFTRYLGATNWSFSLPCPLNAMTDLFLLSGERGDRWTIDELGYKAEDGEFSALERFVESGGVLPGAYGNWGGVQDDTVSTAMTRHASRSRREAFFLKLVEKGMRITNESLSSMIHDGPLDLLPLLFKHATEELIIPDDVLEDLFCVGLPCKFENWTAAALCGALDLLHRPGMVFTEKVSHEGFFECARLKNVQLMEKIRTIGFEPDNGPWSENTILKAIEKEDEDESPWETIKFMIQYGARISQQTVQKFITEPEDQALSLQILAEIAKLEEAEVGLMLRD